MTVTLFELSESQKSDLLIVSKGNGFVTKKAWLLAHIEQDKRNLKPLEGENVNE